MSIGLLHFQRFYVTSCKDGLEDPSTYVQRSLVVMCFVVFLCNHGSMKIHLVSIKIGT